MSERTIDDAPVLADGVMDAVLTHVGGEPEREVGGILAGRLEDGRAHVELAVPALRATGHRTNVTFTHDVWEDVLALLDREHPELRIVGWYHSHPGFGIFLSEYDQFIHQNFFPAEGMVALVVDPHTDASGWFVTRAGATVRNDGDEPVAEPRDRPATGHPPHGGGQAATAAGSRTRAARALVVAVTLLAGFAGGWAGSELTSPTPVDGVGPMRAELAAAIERGEELEAALSALAAETEEPGAKASAEETGQDQATELADDVVRPVVYRIRPGDTLASIAWAFSGSPDYLATLVAANPQLDDPDVLMIGHPLTIPPTDRP